MFDSVLPMRMVLSATTATMAFVIAMAHVHATMATMAPTVNSLVFSMHVAFATATG